MNNLYEALEICLQDIEQGADVDTVLFRYPDLADELRPILEAAAGAKNMAVPAPSAEVVRRNRAKVLQHAAQMREGRVRSSQRIWFASLRRLAVTLAVVAALFVSGTSLVRAASNTLPGDNLYPVKRTWEDVLLLFTFNLQQRQALEIEHENERLHELIELISAGRSAEVDFAGTVTGQSGNEWIVNGFTVVVSAQTEVRDGPITVGSAVRVRGWTQPGGTVLAERIRVLDSDENLPDVEYQHEKDENSNEGSGEQNEDHSGPGSGDETPEVRESRTPESEESPKQESLEGVVVSIDNKQLIVNDIVVDFSAAEEIKGTPGIGVMVKVEGYYDANGVFIVTKIEFRDNGSGSGSSDHSGDDNTNDGSTDTGNDNNNDNTNSDDHSGSGGGGSDNSNDDSHNNDNGDDSGGGGDNSGSGSGGGSND